MKYVFILLAWYLLVALGFSIGLRAKDKRSEERPGHWGPYLVLGLVWPVLLTEKR